MAFWDRFVSAVDAFRRPQASDNRITDPGDLEKVLRQFATGVTSSGVSVGAEQSMRVTAVYSCVRILSSTMAHLPLTLLRRDGENSQPDRDNPMFSLLSVRPNEWQSAFEFKQLMQRDLELRGNAYALKVRGVGGRVQEMIRLHPDQVTPTQDKNTLAITYEYRRPNGQRVFLDRDEVFHLRGMGDDGVTGKSPVQLHRETIGESIVLQEHGGRFFSNGAKPLGVISQEATVKLEGDARKDFKADLAELHSGTANAHKPLLLPAGFKYDPIAISPEDAQYIEGRKFTRSEIYSIWGVPPHKAGDLERATFSNIEHQSIDFVIDAIVPRAVHWEQAAQRDLLEGDDARFFKFNVSALLRGDAKSRAEALQIQRRNGVINANEWRALEDRNPREDEGGDEYIVESNMTISSLLGQQGNGNDES